MEELSVFYTPAGGEAEEITEIIEGLSISEQDGSRTAEISLSLSDERGQYLRSPQIMAGDTVTIKTGGEVLYIFSVEKASREYPKRKVSGRDFGLFLEQNEIVIQFDGDSVSDGVKKVFAQVGISEYDVPEMGAAISGVYCDSCEDILEELLDTQRLSDGKERDWRLEGEKVVIFEVGGEVIELRHKPAENVAEFDAGVYHGRGSYGHDISGMYNAVKAVIKSTSEGEMPSVEYTAEDSELIKKYGRREKLLNVSSDKEAEIESLAAEELKEVSEIDRTLKAEFPGVTSARRGKAFNFKDEYLGIEGTVRILSVKHSFSEGRYTMEMEMKMM